MYAPGAQATTASKYGEPGMLKADYPKIPGRRTRLRYFVDDALKEEDYNVSLTLSPSAAKAVWYEEHGLLTGNGPQAVDDLAVKLAEISEDSLEDKASKASTRGAVDP